MSEKDEQIARGVLVCEVWSDVLQKDSEDVMEAVRENENLAEEFDSLLLGESHEFGRVIADHFGLPYHPAGNSIKLGQPYGSRYQQAWIDVGVEPSTAEKIANAVVFGVLGRE